ncbi:MAG: hypothetical protein A3I61_00015 [Acidobacteria bacterium RIFCSPLOWO2_02_FULL_68_18]|nr:MAG: hypothetical protein A3I61_00015 [Acidobacteria bacterium RIFCSPLOWO2_02_FULL_68_18]OFW48760.1 MAG: hypothetical protein A3G77_14775 [Acidobacteria bacterium RIFCSPLOWO2_12_FULL_68_19]
MLERAAYEALSAATGIPLIDLESTEVSPLALRLVPEPLARRHLVLPIAEDNRSLTYATAQPFAAEVDTDLSLTSGRQADPRLARPSQLTPALDRCYPRSSGVEPRRAPICGRAASTAPGARRVLIVDDDRMIRMLVGLLLQRGGYQVLEARNGREGIDMAVAHRPDLLITDLLMPEVDGYETLSALRADEACARMPVIVLTADSGPEVERTVLSLGADDYLIKPFDAEVLLRRVRSVFLRRLPLAS